MRIFLCSIQSLLGSFSHLLPNASPSISRLLLCPYSNPPSPTSRSHHPILHPPPFFTRRPPLPKAQPWLTALHSTLPCLTAPCLKPLFLRIIYFFLLRLTPPSAEPRPHSRIVRSEEVSVDAVYDVPLRFFRVGGFFFRFYFHVPNVRLLLLCGVLSGFCIFFFLSFFFVWIFLCLQPFFSGWEMCGFVEGVSSSGCFARFVEACLYFFEFCDSSSFSLAFFLAWGPGKGLLMLQEKSLVSLYCLFWEFPFSWTQHSWVVARFIFCMTCPLIRHTPTFSCLCLGPPLQMGAVFFGFLVFFFVSYPLSFPVADRTWASDQGYRTRWRERVFLSLSPFFWCTIMSFCLFSFESLSQRVLGLSNGAWFLGRWM